MSLILNDPYYLGVPEHSDLKLVSKISGLYDLLKLFFERQIETPIKICIGKY